MCVLTCNPTSFLELVYLLLFVRQHAVPHKVTANTTSTVQHSAERHILVPVTAVRTAARSSTQSSSKHHKYCAAQRWAPHPGASNRCHVKMSNITKQNKISAKLKHTAGSFGGPTQWRSRNNLMQ